MAITDTVSIGWGSRIKNSIGGMLFGFVLIAGAVVGLWLNEGRAIHRHQDLEMGEKGTISVASDKIDPANEAKLIHFSNTSKAGSTPEDAQFGVSAEGALKLERTVEMYQNQENSSTSTTKKTGGSTESTTSYSYEKVWSDSLIDSSEFHEQGHQNPTAMEYQSSTIIGDPITVGAFTLSDSLVGRLNSFNPLPVSSIDSVPEAIREKVKLHEGGLFFGADPANPQIGDMRITFATVAADEVSVISQQSGTTLTPFQARHGKVELLQVGTHAKEAMFEKAKSNNNALTWALRIGGFLAMAFGLNLLAKPITVIADVLPFVGNIVGAGLGFIMTLLAGVISFVVIAVAWITYRPLIGIPLLIIAGALGFLIVKKSRSAGTSSTDSQPATAGGPPPLN